MPGSSPWSQGRQHPDLHREMQVVSAALLKCGHRAGARDSVLGAVGSAATLLHKRIRGCRLGLMPVLQHL